jgi:methionyl-tRNA formyltransferase
MRLAFLGTPEAAVPSLRALVDAGHDVALVITRPDRRRGRGSEVSPSPVKSAALDLGLQVGHQLGDLEGLSIELGVVVAYGALIRASILETMPMLNVHFSLLPRWRGAAPVERAILAGDEVTGVSIMSLEVELDTGPIHLERSLDVGEKRVTELRDELAQLGASSLLEVLASPELLDHPTIQQGVTTYAEKLTKETFHLVPTMAQDELLRTVRLERAFTFLNGRRLLVSRAHPGTTSSMTPGHLALVDGDVCLVAKGATIVLDEVQPGGSKVMSAAAWWAGARLDAADATWS